MQNKSATMWEKNHKIIKTWFYWIKWNYLIIYTSTKTIETGCMPSKKNPGNDS